MATGVGFFDHMLDQLSRHSLIDMKVEAKGDLHIDDHHTVEDTGIALGQALSKALGDRRGIMRYASIDLAMDETLTRAAIDVSGRPFLVWNVAFSAPKIGTFDTELVREFFQALAQNAGITLHVTNHYGANNHHIAETCFKAVARALRTAARNRSAPARRVPSTKGTPEGIADGHPCRHGAARRAATERRWRTPSSFATASHFLGFIAPPLWLLWHRLWLAAVAGLGSRRSRWPWRSKPRASPFPRRLLPLLVSLYVGLEGAGLRIAALRRARLARVGRGRGGLDRRCRSALPATPTARPTDRAGLARCHLAGRHRAADAFGRGARPRCTIPEDTDMRVAIIDYGSGNLRSATKAFERAAREAGIAAEIDLTADAERVAHRRPHRAAGRRRLCRLRRRPRRRATACGRRSRKSPIAQGAGPSSASASACS